MPFPMLDVSYISTATEGESLGIITFEFSAKVIGADGRNTLILSYADIFASESKRRGTITTCTGDLVYALTPP